MWPVHNSLNPLVSLVFACPLKRAEGQFPFVLNVTHSFLPSISIEIFMCWHLQVVLKKLLNILLVCLRSPQTTSCEANEDKMPVIFCGPFLLMTAERSVYLEQSSGQSLCRCEGLCMIHTFILHSFQFSFLMHFLDLLSKQSFSHILLKVLWKLFVNRSVFKNGLNDLHRNSKCSGFILLVHWLFLIPVVLHYVWHVLRVF